MKAEDDVSGRLTTKSLGIKASGTGDFPAAPDSSLLLIGGSAGCSGSDSLPLSLDAITAQNRELQRFPPARIICIRV